LVALGWRWGKSVSGQQMQWTDRRMVIIAGVAIAALAFWLSPRNHPAPKVAAPAPAPAGQGAPMMADDPWADVG
jgi:hypothetical protein